MPLLRHFLADGPLSCLIFSAGNWLSAGEAIAAKCWPPCRGVIKYQRPLAWRHIAAQNTCAALIFQEESSISISATPRKRHNHAMYLKAAIWRNYIRRCQMRRHRRFAAVCRPYFTTAPWPMAMICAAVFSERCHWYGIIGEIVEPPYMSIDIIATFVSPPHARQAVSHGMPPAELCQLLACLFRDYMISYKYIGLPSIKRSIWDGLYYYHWLHHIIKIFSILKDFNASDY